MRASQLVVKIYLYSVLTLVVTAVLIFAFNEISASGRRRDLSLISEHLVVDMAQRRHDPEALRGDVLRLRPARHIKVSLYQPDGRLIATTVEPPLPMPAPAQVAALTTAAEHAKHDTDAENTLEVAPWRFAHAVREDGHVVAIGVASHLVPRSVGSLLVLLLLLLLAVLVAAAILFARHLAVPLQAVAAAAQRFGRGDLGVRLRSQRKDEIGAVARAFDDMANRVSRLMTSQQELMANVSHELQTPLSRIRVAVDLMSDGDAARAEDMLGEITQDLEELERLIDDVMTLARLDLTRAGAAGYEPRLRREEVGLSELLGRACVRFRSLHDTHVLVAEVPGGLPTISADPVLLRRVFDNVLDNARKYSPEGTEICLHAERSADGTVITIADHGMGIEPADLEQVFTPFFRSDRSRSRATGGVGLGLALARRVLEAHAAQIGVASVIGKGTTVTISVPAQSP